MPVTLFVVNKSIPLRGKTKVAITSRVTIPDMMGNARSFLSSIRIRQLAFTSPKLRIIRSNIVLCWHSQGMNVFLALIGRMGSPAKEDAQKNR